MHNVVILSKSVFNENYNHHYDKVFRKMFTQIIQKCCIMIELTFLKVLILIRQVH